MFLYDRNIGSSSASPRKSSVIFGNRQQSSEIFENVRKRLSGLQTTFRESSESVGKSWENHQKVVITVCLYNQQNNTWVLVDPYGIFLRVFNLISHEIAKRTSEISRRTLPYLRAPMYYPPYHHLYIGRNKLEEKSRNQTDLREAAL